MLAELATREICGACGIPPSLFQQNSDGTAQRESWRRFLFGTVSPLGRMVEADLRTKLDPDISLQWQELRASDLSGRARAFQSLVGGGIEIKRAAGLSGLLQD